MLMKWLEDWLNPKDERAERLQHVSRETHGTAQFATGEDIHSHGLYHPREENRK